MLNRTWHEEVPASGSEKREGKNFQFKTSKGISKSKVVPDYRTVKAFRPMRNGLIVDLDAGRGEKKGKQKRLRQYRNSVAANRDIRGRQ